VTSRSHLHERRTTEPPVGALLLLHGGRERGRGPVTPLNLAFLRVDLMARAVHPTLAARGISVWTLRFAITGWNGDDASPVPGTRDAIAEVARRSRAPIVLAGHSMGGRAALATAAEPGLVGVIGLAPWIPPGEPVSDFTSRRLVIAHGTADRTTDPRASHRYLEACRPQATSVAEYPIKGGHHAMLDHRSEWNRILVESTLDLLGAG
jgi:predicted esterase